MARNNSRGTTTSASWKTIVREWRTTFAPILINFSRNVVNVQWRLVCRHSASLIFTLVNDNVLYIHYLGWQACDRSWRQLPEVQVFRAGEANSLVNTCRFRGSNPGKASNEQKTAPLFRFVFYSMYWLRNAA